MLPKTITYRSYKNFSEEHLKEAIRSDCSYIDDGNLASVQHVIEKRPDQFAPMKKIVLRGNTKPHMTSQLRKAIIKRSQLENKANEIDKPADETAYKKQRNLVVKLNEKPRKPFLKNQITENATNKTKIFWKNLISLKTVFITNRN